MGNILDITLGRAHGSTSGTFVLTKAESYMFWLSWLKIFHTFGHHFFFPALIRLVTLSLLSIAYINLSMCGSSCLLSTNNYCWFLFLESIYILNLIFLALSLRCKFEGNKRLEGSFRRKGNCRLFGRKENWREENSGEKKDHGSHYFSIFNPSKNGRVFK